MGDLTDLVGNQVRYPGWDEHRLARAVVDRYALGGGLQDDGADGDDGNLRAGVGVPPTAGTGPQPQPLHQKRRVAVGVDLDRREGVTPSDVSSGDVPIRGRGTNRRQRQSDTQSRESCRHD